VPAAEAKQRKIGEFLTKERFFFRQVFSVGHRSLYVPYSAAIAGFGTVAAILML
jgi:hypothetical protein